MSTQLQLDLPQERVFSVSEISHQIKRHVEGQFSKIQVRGEITGLKIHTSGHAYFALKDTDAVIDAVCWRGTKLATSLEEGLEIIARGRITTYPGRSKYQMVVESASVAGAGALLQLLMARKKKYQEMGLFNNKRPLPFFPKVIGVITSPTGAVIRDILHRIEDRFPTHVLIWPVLVQGNGAAEQVAYALRHFEHITPKPDVLIVARGGGSLEDLWTFNEEVVIEAAAQCSIPIISAIGHETDTTLMDYVADVRAPTPTAAAEMATPVKMQLLQTLKNMDLQAINHIQRRIEHGQLRLDVIGKSLPNLEHLMDNYQIRLDDLFSHGLKNIKTNITQHAQRLDVLSNTLEHVSYKKVLDRGFAWVESGEGAAVLRAQDFAKQHGKKTTIHWVDGPVTFVPDMEPLHKNEAILKAG